MKRRNKDANTDIKTHMDLSMNKRFEFRGDVFEDVRARCKQKQRVRVTPLFPRLSSQWIERRFHFVRNHGRYSNPNPSQEEGYKA